MTTPQDFEFDAAYRATSRERYAPATGPPLMPSASRLVGDRAPRRGVQVVTQATTGFTPTEGERPG